MESPLTTQVCAEPKLNRFSLCLPCFHASSPRPMNILLDPLVVAPGADPASVPTLSTWAMLLLMTGLAVLAGPGLARKRGGASR
jgi:hypothetical protein